MTTLKPATVSQWLRAAAIEHGNAPALLSIGQPVLSYAGLEQQVSAVAAALRSAGIGPADVVLIGLPDGPEALVTILAASTLAAAFPLAAHEQPQRYVDLLDEVPVRAVIATDRILDLIQPVLTERSIVAGRPHVAAGAAAGVFELELSGAKGPVTNAESSLSDAAILIATSGATAKPKIVASSHESLHASISHCAAWMKLTPADRSLCVMPFSHLHALVRSTLPALMSGAQVVATPGFDSASVLRWIDEFRPTVITAAPSVYRRIAAVANRTGWKARSPSLRLLVTGSDRTDAETSDEAARILEARVVQFYGLSEVAPLIATSNVGENLPPGAIGRVNPPWTVSILDEDGSVLPRGAEGEIAVAGGFINPLIGRSAPTQRRTNDGRLLTGDIGRMERNTLFVTGRLDDRIHRGGEKIDPRAVEAVLLTHPSVSRVVVFPVPDSGLGQRVGAVVVTSGTTPAAETLQAYAAERLFAHMVPETIVFTPALPLNAAGKVARSTIAAQLGIASTGVVAAPPAEQHAASDAVEHRLHEMFSARLGRTNVSLSDSFAKIGGDSFGAIELLLQIEDEFGVSIPPATFNSNDSIAALARLIAAARLEVDAKLKLVTLNASGRFPPLFIPYGRQGQVGFASAVSDALGPDQPIFAFHAPGMEDESAKPARVEEKATEMIELIRGKQAKGPYYLAGYSFGSHLAFEIAQQLVAGGDAVAFLGVIDDSADLMRRWQNIENTPPKTMTTKTVNDWALRRYVPKPYPGDIVLFRASEPVEVYQSEPDAGWGELAQSVTFCDVPGEHEFMMTSSGFRWGAQLSVALAKARHAASAAPQAGAKPKLSPAVRHTIAARVACKQGDRRKEIAEYQKAMALGSAPLWVLRNLAAALLEDGKVDESVRVAEMANAVDPWPFYHLVRLAELFASLNRPIDVRRVYEQARALVAYDTDTMRHYAHICRLAGKLDEAEAAIRQAIALDERSSFAHNYRSDLRVYLSDILVALRRIPEAISAAVEAAELDPHNAEKATRVARLCTSAGRTAEAQTWRMRASLATPGNRPAGTTAQGVYGATRNLPTTAPDGDSTTTVSVPPPAA
jgi:acyl-CoA synthetase (AMP-forming)/AMP-acid ligase II/thioesterase domain-containing protein/acyl carrier protein/tetratricopeptide (TPR) repeat protein